MFNKTPPEHILNSVVTMLKPYCKEITETKLVDALQNRNNEPENKPLPKFVDKNKAAECLEVSTSTIIRMCKRRELRAQKVGQQWRIDVESLRDVPENENYD